MNPLELQKTALSGCYELLPRVLRDARGQFVKVFHEATFARLGLAEHFAEQYCSASQARVLRGLHFQLPPHDHVKVVYCISGKILDVVVDLRRGSPTYGQFVAVQLSAAAGNGIYIPKGLAHGFYVLGDSATVMCMTTTVHAPEHDAGIRWDTAGIPWPDMNPILSERDRQLPGIEAFDSPFEFTVPLQR